MSRTFGNRTSRRSAGLAMQRGPVHLGQKAKYSLGQHRRHVGKVPGTEVATTFMCMHYRWPRCVDDRSRSICQDPIVGEGAYAIPVTVDRVLAGCPLEFLFESQAIPETQLTSLGADNDEISRHRIYGRSRHRAALVEMVRVGCGRGDHGPSAQ